MDKDEMVSVESSRNECLRDEIDRQVYFQTLDWITGRPTERGWNLSRTKRVVGFVGACVLLVMLAPLLGGIAIAVMMTSKGPIFFLQERTGYMGRRFTMFKFRTMVENAESLKTELNHLSHHANDSPDFKIIGDPRITAVGGFLRNYSLDELPQIYNVLIGKMSFVGPRPTSFSVDDYSNHHLSRLASRPGLTGIWQVSGRSNVDFEGRVALDRQYVENQGPWQDFQILVKTPLTVLKGDGAY